MGQFSGKDDFTTAALDNGDAGGLAAGIELDPEFLHRTALNAFLENEREGVTAEHCRLA